MSLSREQWFRGGQEGKLDVKRKRKEPENQNRNCMAQINLVPGGLRGPGPCPPARGCSVHLSAPTRPACLQEVLAGAGGPASRPCETGAGAVTQAPGMGSPCRPCGESRGLAPEGRLGRVTH